MPCLLELGQGMLQCGLVASDYRVHQGIGELAPDGRADLTDHLHRRQAVEPRHQRVVHAAFREGLQKLGWAEGRNIRIDTRWATADVESIQRFAKELVALQLERVVSTSTPSALEG